MFTTVTSFDEVGNVLTGAGLQMLCELEKAFSTREGEGGLHPSLCARAPRWGRVRLLPSAARSDPPAPSPWCCQVVMDHPYYEEICLHVPCCAGLRASMSGMCTGTDAELYDGLCRVDGATDVCWKPLSILRALDDPSTGVPASCDSLDDTSIDAIMTNIVACITFSHSSKTDYTADHRCRYLRYMGVEVTGAQITGAADGSSDSNPVCVKYPIVALGDRSFDEFNNDRTSKAIRSTMVFKKPAFEMKVWLPPFWLLHCPILPKCLPPRAPLLA